MKQKNVLTIGYDKQIFDPTSISAERMRAIGSHLEQFIILVFTLKKDNVPAKVQYQNITVYGTNSSSKIGMVFSGIFKALRITNGAVFTWYVSTQDPFEAGLVGLCVKRLRKNIRLNIQEHGDFYSTVHWRNEAFLNRFRYYVGKYILKQASSVRVVSLRIKESIGRIIPARIPITVVPVRTNYTAFMNADSNLASGYMSNNNKILLSVARFEKQKNLDLLIDSFTEVSAEFPEYTLLLVGKGSLEQNLKQKVSTLQMNHAIQFLPWSNTVPQLMQQATVYALSSNYEGWAMVLIEAMAAGLPIITTNVGCVGEVVMPGIHATVVPVANKLQYTQALRHLLASTELQQTYSQNSLDSVRQLQQKFSYEGYSEKWLQSTLV